MQIIRTPGAERQHSPAHLAENLRAQNVAPGTFRVQTRDDAGATHLDDEHVGTFDGAIRHALVCARSIRSRFELDETTCDVTDADGQLVYSVSAHGGGIRTRRLPLVAH